MEKVIIASLLESSLFAAKFWHLVSMKAEWFDLAPNYNGLMDWTSKIKNVLLKKIFMQPYYKIGLIHEAQNEGEMDSKK